MRKLLVVLAAAGMVLAGCGALTSYAARVNGTTITENELDRQLKAILANKGYLEWREQQFSQSTGGLRLKGVGGEKTFNSKFVAGILEEWIFVELVRQERVRRGLQVTDAHLDQAGQELRAGIPGLEGFPKEYVDYITRANAEVTVLQQALAPPADEAAVKSFYDSNPARFQANCLRQIVVGDQAKAAELKGRVERGEDFAALARSESTDKEGPEGGSSVRGGDLGCLPPGSFEESFGAAFDAAVAALQPNQVSDPIQSPMGFHVVQLTDRRTRSFEEAAPSIRNALAARAAPGALPQLIEEAARKANIDVNPRYGRFVREEQTVGIKTPDELTTTTSAPEQLPEQ